MEVKKVAFAKSMKQPQDYPDSGLPEIAFAGKSNVGKSSLINYIANHSKLAYVSKQPGKTRLINYYLVNDCFYLVDLPGYGFARVSKTEKDSWDEMMRLYFEIAKNLKALIILVDIRHKPTQDDLQMIQWALYYGVPFCIAATKADKIAKSKRYHYAVQMAKNISAALEEDLDLSIIPISSAGKYGKDTLLRYVEKMITPGGTLE